jgi:hypothetical protein
VQDNVRPELDGLVDEGLERAVGVDLPLVQALERPVLVADPAVSGVSDMSVGDMDDPQKPSSPWFTGPLNGAGLF